MRDTIDMAREAGFEIDCTSLDWHKRIKAFQALVRADEREACAKMCEGATELGCEYWSDVAEAIRARGNT